MYACKLEKMLICKDDQKLEEMAWEQWLVIGTKRKRS